MGRYYNGDIEGKFWFGVQDSLDAQYFGGNYFEPNHVTFEFVKDDMETIEKGIANCLKELGDQKSKLDVFFDHEAGYNDEMLMKELNIDKDEVDRLIMWYARLCLGEKIRDCVKKHDECNFEAEL